MQPPSSYFQNLNVTISEMMLSGERVLNGAYFKINW
jgi:hypothetical protein